MSELNTTPVLEPALQPSGFARTLVLALAALNLYLLNCGSMVLMDPDEGRCVLIAQEMIRSGNWLVPASPLSGEPYFDKPILYFWLLAVAIKSLGATEFSARLVTAVGAAILVGTVDRLGRLLFNPRAGFLSAVMFASCAFMIIAGRFVRMDVWFTLFITLAIFCWSRWHLREGPTWLLLCGYLSISAAVLTKGLVGMLLPAAAIGCFLIVRRPPLWHVLWRSRLLTGLAIIFCTAGPWYAWMEAQYPGYLIDFFYRHHFLRATTDTFGRSQTIVYLPGVVLAGIVPWTAILAGALFRALPLRWNAGWKSSDGEHLCLWWLIWGLVPLMLSRTQLPIYTLPAFSAVALLAGIYLDRLLQQASEYAREPRMILGATFGCIVLAVVALAMINWYSFNDHPWWTLARRMPIVGAGVVAGLWLLRRQHNMAVFSLTVLMTVGGVVDIAWFEGPAMANWSSTAGLGRQIRANRLDEDLLLIGPAPAFGAVVYSRSAIPVQYVNHILDFLGAADHPRPLLGLMTSPLLRELATQQLKGRIEVLAQHRENTLVRVRPRSVLAPNSQPAPMTSSQGS